MATRDPREIAILAQRNAGIRRTSATAIVSLAETVYSAYGGYGTSISKGLAQAIMHIGTAPARSEQEEMYKRLGKLTHDVVLDVYDQVAGNDLGAKGYRAGSGKNDRLTGKLRPPIAANTEGTIYKIVSAPNVNGGVRIELFNMKHLSRVAKHWARINFGAGPEGADDPINVFQFGLGGRSQTLSFGQGARDAYRIPKGYWYSQNDEATDPGAPVLGDKFYLRRRPGMGSARQQTPKLTRGFGGRGFLDAGLGAFARAAPEEFTEFLQDLLGKRTRLKLHFDVKASSKRY